MDFMIFGICRPFSHPLFNTVLLFLVVCSACYHQDCSDIVLDTNSPCVQTSNIVETTSKPLVRPAIRLVLVLGLPLFIELTQQLNWFVSLPALFCCIFHMLALKQLIFSPTSQ